ncbi:MAG: DUF1330 domain-containing protein [bacterium]
MAAYVIVDVEVMDPVRYEDYKILSGASLGAHGARFLVRGGKTETLEGVRKPGRIVVIEFPTSDDARRWWNSDAYAPAKALRNATAKTEMILVEGV